MIPAPRTMLPGELRIVLDWAAAEGWNPGHDDAAAFLAADPGGFFAAGPPEAPVAAISVVNHDPGFAFLGLYLVHPDWRGQGIGYALWQHALAHAEARTVGLDGVPAQQDNYRASGFAAAGHTARYEGAVRGATGSDIRTVRPADLPGLIAMDTAANGYSKAAFLRVWLTDTATRRTLVLDRGGKRMGFVTLRACRIGTKIGPLVATTVAEAETLMRAAAQDAGGGPLIVDVPGDQTALNALCEAEGMACGFTTARMYRGPAPLSQPLVASAGTLELG